MGILQLPKRGVRWGQRWNPSIQGPSTICRPTGLAHSEKSASHHPSAPALQTNKDFARRGEFLDDTHFSTGFSTHNSVPNRQPDIAPTTGIGDWRVIINELGCRNAIGWRAGTSLPRTQMDLCQFAGLHECNCVIYKFIESSECAEWTSVAGLTQDIW